MQIVKIFNYCQKIKISVMKQTLTNRSFSKENDLLEYIQIGGVLDLHFQNCELKDLDLTADSVYRCKFENSKFTTVSFRKSEMHDLHFENCTFSKVNFGRIEGVNLTFQNCQFVETDFTGGELQNCNFEKCHFLKTNFKSLDLVNCHLKRFTQDSCQLDNLLVDNVVFESETVQDSKRLIELLQNNF